MANNNTAVFGIYRNSAEAETAVDKAKLAVNQIVEFRVVAGGFTHNDISVLLPDANGSKDFARERHTKAPEATIGANIGGAIGGTPALLAGIGALISFGIPESEAKLYEGWVKDGAVFLSVHCETLDQISRATDLLKHTGAEDISSVVEKVVSSQAVGSETSSTSA